MTIIAMLAAGEPAISGINPLQLFLDAGPVVQLVISLLLLASIWVWKIIISFALGMGSLNRKSASFEEDFWEADQPEALLSSRKKLNNPSARVVAAGLTELRRSTKAGVRRGEGTKQRVALVMEGQVAEEADALAHKLNFLATTGPVAPFVGLFGTVWGIMNSFFNIGVQQNSSLAVVAPGISEALFATAVGLFAAIPAVIAYNHFSGKVNAFEARLQRFADKFHTQISRELESN